MVKLADPPTLVVLAGGRGARMGSLTGSTPKALLPVGGEPFLVRLLRQFAEAGTTDVVLCTGYRAADIIDTIGDGAHLGLAVAHEVEPVPLGTIGALRRAGPRLPDSFLLTYCDVVPRIPADWFAEQSRSTPTAAAMAVGMPVDPINANVIVREKLVVSYAKPSPPGALLADRGLLAFERSALDRYRGDDECSFYAALAAAGDLTAIPVTTPEDHIGTRKHYDQVVAQAEKL
ncbi:hypothetical protein CH275_16515 [Rhodococcus sp. 06-235-1A]|uniref:NTP transferase domain-containing protein n=1 Tax=Rhodococcus sp. 06-235-1A TaxID=2022508 RepID=UPI000B9B2D40|nr:NTP transferase domain-containing protein [Rhodococcus sp. 06-235-1A]OZD03381.1 hypothetical protein CH275_16515 [Rhodococcus sp. 06-235-1A]